MTVEEERKAFEEKKKSKLERVVAPDVSQRREIRRRLDDSAYFIIIGLISLLAVFLPPLFMGCLSSDIGLAFPKNLEGWILWSVMNASTAIANISLLVLFKLQAKKNSRNDPNFKRANEILNRLSGVKEIFIPRSPRKMDAGDYTRKIITIVISTFTASVTLTSLVLSFSWMTLLSCLVSIIITLCVSWITMINNEEYWCEEYILYAEMMEKKRQEELAQLEQANESVEEPVPEEASEVSQKCEEEKKEDA